MTNKNVYIGFLIGILIIVVACVVVIIRSKSNTSKPSNDKSTDKEENPSNAVVPDDKPIFTTQPIKPMPSIIVRDRPLSANQSNKAN